ncbi:hypothetical protein XENTR_v10014424 [Xenopus tropicalis]|nr:hypothetical protein XENTR_v10014424 [Xenopus tropicalis]
MPTPAFLPSKGQFAYYASWGIRILPVLDLFLALCLALCYTLCFILQSLDTAVVLDGSSHSVSSEEKSAADLAAKILLLDELVSLENDVIETKKKRSFPGFGSPLDRLSAGTTEFKGKQRKVVELPKRRFGIPLDRIGMNRLANTRG